MNMHKKAHRLLSVLLCMTLLLSCVVITGVSAAIGEVEYDFESNPGDKYGATAEATNNTYRNDVRTSLETAAEHAQSGTGAMKLAFLTTPVVKTAGPAFRILDGDDTNFAPTAEAYYRVTLSYYVEKATCDFNLRLIFAPKNWATTTNVTDGDGATLATVTTADKVGEWVTVSAVVKCSYYRAHLALYAPGGGKAGTTVYVDDLSMTPLTDASSVVPMTLEPNYEDATAVTGYAVTGETYTPASMLRTGYRLIGWYTDPDCTAAYSGQVTEATTLYAGWAPRGTVSHPAMLDFESSAFAEGDSLNLSSTGSVTVSADYNHTTGGYYAACVSVDTNAGDVRPQFNLTDAYGTPLRVKAGDNVKLSFWVYVPEDATHTSVRYWLAVTESTTGYTTTNQKNDEAVLEPADITGTAGSWVHVTGAVQALPRDGYLRLGICSTKTDQMTFYVDDIHAVLLSGEETVLDHEALSTESLDHIRYGTATVSAAQDHTTGDGRSLCLSGISWGGYSRNQMILTDPATMEPYTFTVGDYYSLSMWVYTTVTGFKPNIWLWGTDDASLAFTTSDDKNAKTGFEYDGVAAADTQDGLLTAGQWTRVSLTFCVANGQHMLMGITNGAYQNGGYTYYIDDMQISKAPAATVTLVGNGGTFTEGETKTVFSAIGAQLSYAVEEPTREGYEFTGWYWDAANTRLCDTTQKIATEAVTLYAGWRAWMGTCYHEFSCDTVCRICGEYGSHQNDGVWSTDATGHWYACAVCGEYISGDVHSYTSDCDGTCDGCGYDRGATHTMVMCYSATGHSLQCAACGLTESFVSHTYSNDEDVTCDGCGYVRYAVGDIDLDGDVDDGDATYLAYHLFFPEYYPVYRNADVDRNGKVNDADALYLKRHLQSPQEYPLDAPPTPVTGQDDRQAALG